MLMDRIQADHNRQLTAPPTIGVMPDAGVGMVISPIIHPRDGQRDPRSRTFWSATANALYIVRQQGSDRFGNTPDVAAKLSEGNDLVDYGRRGPIGCHLEAVAGLKVWQAADEAAKEDRPSAPVGFHAIGWLPSTTTAERWREIVQEVLDREVVANGMIADWAIHALPGADGRWIKKPHAHAILTHRFWKAGRRTGEPNPAWLGGAKWRQRLIDAWNVSAGFDDYART